MTKSTATCLRSLHFDDAAMPMLNTGSPVRGIRELLDVSKHFLRREAVRRCRVEVVPCFLMKELKRRVESQAADGTEGADHEERQDQAI